MTTDFLVIGAQKCGTTTVHADLNAHPSICTADKEASILLSGSPAKVRALYQKAFARSDGATCGEVTTTYTMLPLHSEITGLARTCAPDAKIIYIVREPLARIISHHHHVYAEGIVGPDIDEVVLSYPPLLDNTRYATQISPWIESFGSSRVKIIRFETYMADRSRGSKELYEWLGLPAIDVPGLDVSHNVAETKHVARGAWRSIAFSETYRKRVRPYIPGSLRRWTSATILPTAPPRPSEPSATTVEMIERELLPEIERLGAITGEGPWWSLGDERAKENP